MLEPLSEDVIYLQIDNQQGSYGIISPFYIFMCFTDRQNAILIGSLLGDGYLHRNAYDSVSWEVKVKENHKDYIEWLYKEFKEEIKRRPYLRKDTNQWRLYTCYSKKFLYWWKKFYYKGKKKVPEDIQKILVNPLSLAVWYMDDGSLDFREKSHFSLSLATYNFSYKEHKLLEETFTKNFGIKIRIHKTSCRGKSYFRIYIGKGEQIKFLRLVKPFIVESFKYKIPNFILKEK